LKVRLSALAWGRGLACLALVYGPFATSASSFAAPEKTRRGSPLAGVAVATLAWADGPIERESATGKTGWQQLAVGESVRTGDRLRTPPEGLARFEFPWMSVIAGPATLMHIPAEVVLSTVVAQGRAEFQARGRDIVKVRTADAEIRGRGRIVVRRERERTLVMVMAMEGAFSVVAAGTTVALRGGQGTIVSDGKAPEPAQDLPGAPEGLVPGVDPVYVTSGQPVTLKWSPTPAGTAFHVQLTGMNSDEVLIARDVTGPSYALVIPWEGTYRWRVAARAGSGLESPPSGDGFICVVEK
jgi:hypothetical protein